MESLKLPLDRKPSSKQLSVAIFWDRENVSIEHTFLAMYLLVFANLIGCLTSANVYANWDINLDVKQHLIKRGYNCIHVPGNTKNAVDNQLIADGNEKINSSDSLDIIILVAGDGDYVKPIRDWQAKGKEVIVFAQKGSESQKLIKLVSKSNFHFVEELPELIQLELQRQKSSVSSYISYNDATTWLIETIRIALDKGKRIAVSNIDKRMRQSFPKYRGVASIRKHDNSKFSSFSKFIDAVVKDGKVKIENGELFLI